MSTDTPGLPREVAAYIRRFESRGAPPGYRRRVNDFAREAAIASAPETISEAAGRLSTAAGIAAWCLAVGIPLECRFVFRPDTIERYIHEGCPRSAKGLRQTRTKLRSLGRIVEPQLYSSLPQRSQGEVKGPYSDLEIAGLLRLADRQPTELARRRLGAIISLGAGAGLDSSEMRHVHGSDIRPTEQGVTVAIRESAHPRLVIARSAFAERLSRIGHVCGERPIFKPESSRVVAGVVERLVGGRDLPRVDVDRLRATWLTAHLEAIGFREFLAAAGIRKSNGIFDLAFMLPEPTFADIVEVLRRADR